MPLFKKLFTRKANPKGYQRLEEQKCDQGQPKVTAEHSTVGAAVAVDATEPGESEPSNALISSVR